MAERAVQALPGGDLVLRGLDVPVSQHPDMPEHRRQAVEAVCREQEEPE